jgi:TPR repeat protein
MKTITLLMLLIFSSSADDAQLFRDQCTKGYAKACTLLGYMIKTKEINGTAEEMVDALDKGCKLRNAPACSMLGEIKIDGTNGVERDTFAGFSLIERAYTILKEDPEQNNGSMLSSTRAKLASLYEDGVGVRQDDEKAIALYKIGCDKKDGLGCYGLGNFYAKKNNQKKALEFYGKGCDYKDEGSCVLYSLIKKEMPVLK